MRMLIAVMFVLGCGAKHENTQPASSDDDANPIERITAKALEAADEPDEPDEQEEDPEEQEEEQEEEDEEEPDEQEEEQDVDEMEEDPEPEVSTPAPNFNYVEWTAEPPTLGKPKVPGPPYPYLEAGGKKELFDRLRRYRWLAWEHEQAVDIEEDWIENWEQWEEEGHPIRLLEYRKCSYPKLRTNDPTLKKLMRKYNPIYEARGTWGVHDYDLEQKLNVYGGKAAYSWHNAVKGITTGARYGVLKQRSNSIATRAQQLTQRLMSATRCGRLWLCPTPNIKVSFHCNEWKDTFMED